MLHKDLTGKAEASLNLEQWPEPVQVMPPAPATRSWTLLALICGNVVLGFLLLASLLLMPVWLAGLVSLL